MIQQAADGLDDLDQTDALIIHYLHTEPADDLERYIQQAGKALFLERRFFNTIAKIMEAAK